MACAGAARMSKEEDFIRDMGYLALANRLKRLSEVMMVSGRKLYKELALDIEPSWFLIFLLLQRDGALSVTEIAQKLRYAHPSVVTLVSKMKKKGYLNAHKDEEDGRKQLVTLSTKAKESLPSFETLWASGAQAMEGLLDPGDPFLETLNQLDERLQERSFKQRTLDAMERCKEATIRRAISSDNDGIWEIFYQVIQAGDTYPIDPNTPKEALATYWLAPHMHTYVFERDGRILGTYVLKPNHGAAGSHVGHGSYMVHPDARRQGIGEALCLHSLKEAKRLGFVAIQFNLVVSTNKASIALWNKHGFRIIGTTPEGFKHPQQGLVDTHIMYRKL